MTAPAPIKGERHVPLWLPDGDDPRVCLPAHPWRFANEPRVIVKCR
jgi:hypothetical protein